MTPAGKQLRGGSPASQNRLAARQGFFVSRKAKMSKLLILSDIHGNWAALRAVLDAEHHFQQAVFCGDVVDYGPRPAACLQWVRGNCTHVVRGNHDNALAFELDCRCMGSFRPYSVATRAWHRQILAPADLDFLRQMPAVDWFEWEGRHVRMAHAEPRGNLFECLSPEDWERRLDGIDADFVLLGHTHVQGMRTFGKTTVVNAGSVGLARDKAGGACYAVLEAGEISLKRIPYDVAQAVCELRRAPLPPDVISGLIQVLTPPTEKALETVSNH
jgi:putative phosphoesterase